jgi:hypothetical protein
MQVPPTTLTVADGGALTLGSPLTLVDGATVLFAWSSSARNVSFGSGGVTLADAQGASLGTATGAWPGDVRLAHLTAAGQAAFGAFGASATLSRDAHGAVTASGMPTARYFASASGPCTLTRGGRCVQHGSYHVDGHMEHCDIIVGVGGTLDACPSFDVWSSGQHTYLTIDGIQYSTCPQHVVLAPLSTITWDITGGHSRIFTGWEICLPLGR